MAKNLPADISQQDVLDAIRAFSDRSVVHKFHESEKYDLIHDGNRYPPKAILGIAAKRIMGRVLEPSELSGGESSPCFRLLRRRGFVIEPKPQVATARDSDWSGGEIDAAVGRYLEMLRLEGEGKPFIKAEVNRQLRLGALAGRTKSAVEFRMQNISAVLQKLNRRWITGYRPAANVGTNVETKILASLDRLEALSPEDSVPESDPVALERKVRGIRRVPLALQPEGATAPRKVTRSAEHFERDPRVKAWVLDKARGHCELCGGEAPFMDDDGFPFLEVHHIKPLAEGGADIVENAVALCPNCHRRCHHGHDRNSVARQLRSVAGIRVSKGNATSS
jgi:5-methylcytosine-specific restriction protein A